MYFCSPGGILQPSLSGAVMGLPVCPSFEDSCFLSLCGASLRWGWGMMEPRAGRKLLRDLGHFCRLFDEASVCLSVSIIEALSPFRGQVLCQMLCIGYGFSQCIALLSLS